MQQEDVAVPGWKIRQISRHSSFHGAMSQDTAESKLKKRKSNTFLTRYSESSDQYTLSVRRKTEDKWIVKHYEIVITKENNKAMYEIVGTGDKFHDIAELLQFYKKNALDNHITAIGEAVAKEEEVLSEDAKEEEDVVIATPLLRGSGGMLNRNNDNYNGNNTTTLNNSESNLA
jgi:hypothetical protein